MNNTAIEFTNVSLHYPIYHHLTVGLKSFILNFPKSLIAFRKDRYTAIQDVSFSVKKGERFGIIGRNGAGKSSTLSLIAGVLKPSEGNVTVHGRISPFLELGAGFNHELTGRENIILNGVLMGLRKSAIMKKIDEIIEFSELGSFIEQPIRIYSSGMLTRLGFAVVASLDPEILLIDEVLAVGDAAFSKKCMNRMMEFKNNNTTIVFVSHSMSDVKELCNRAMLLENNTIKAIGDVGNVVGNYEKRLENQHY
jgi:lipopolysaccharide transport system ATP-binding protein